MQQLCTLFGKDFRISDHCDQQPLPSVELTSTIFGRRQRGELESVAETYHSCFVRVVDPALGIFPPCLSPLLTLMRHCHRTHVSLFSNGAGKLFATYLLNLSFEVGETWAVRPSTTHDSRRDWCRVGPRTSISRRTQRPRDPNIGGVPDILLQTLGGVNLLVGEIKGDLRKDEAECQLLAAVRLLQNKQELPILGLLVNPLNIFVYIPSLEERSVFEYSRMAFDVRYFGDVLRALMSYSGTSAILSLVCHLKVDCWLLKISWIL